VANAVIPFPVTETVEWTSKKKNQQKGNGRPGDLAKCAKGAVGLWGGHRDTSTQLENPKEGGRYSNSNLKRKRGPWGVGTNPASNDKTEALGRVRLIRAKAKSTNSCGGRAITKKSPNNLKKLIHGGTNEERREKIVGQPGGEEGQ